MKQRSDCLEVRLAEWLELALATFAKPGQIQVRFHHRQQLPLGAAPPQLKHSRCHRIHIGERYWLVLASLRS